MPPAAALTHVVSSPAGLHVLALIEATRVTGVARNVVEFARLSAAGVGGVTVALMLALIRRMPARSACLPDGMRDHAAAAGVPLDVLMERHRYDQHVVDAMCRLVRERCPQIIETHHVKSHCLVALSGLWRRQIWVAFHHGYTQTDMKVRAYNHLDRWSLRHAAHVVTTNKPFAATLAARGVPPARITVLHNAVRQMSAAPEAIASVAARLAIRPEEYVVLAVGRLSREKGQEYLLQAVPAWKRNVRLVIVGDGPDRRRLEALVARLGIGSRVTFAGFTDDVAPYYRLADVFVLPSLSEGSPNALLEAMACGLPVVATDVGGVPEIAADGRTALLGPARDPAFLAYGVDRLMWNRALGARLGASARERVLNQHTPEQRAATLSRLYARLAAAD